MWEVEMAGGKIRDDQEINMIYKLKSENSAKKISYTKT